MQRRARRDKNPERGQSLWKLWREVSDIYAGRSQSEWGGFRSGPDVYMNQDKAENLVVLQDALREHGYANTAEQVRKWCRQYDSFKRRERGEPIHARSPDFDLWKSLAKNVRRAIGEIERGRKENIRWWNDPHSRSSRPIQIRKSHGTDSEYKYLTQGRKAYEVIVVEPAKPPTGTIYRTMESGAVRLTHQQTEWPQVFLVDAAYVTEKPRTVFHLQKLRLVQGARWHYDGRDPPRRRRS